VGEHLIFSLFLLLAIAALLFGLRKIPEFLQHFGNGPRGGPPTHPLPVTSEIETSRGSAGSNKARPGGLNDKS
jgi:hypothetical protein